MKTFILIAALGLFISGCESKPVASTKEHRGDPSQSVAYDRFVVRRTAELQQMGGKLQDRGTASLKAQEEANSTFGGPPGDSVTTTWSSGKAQAQEEFTDKLDDMEKAKRGK